jgi:hypothetical protein
MHDYSLLCSICLDLVSRERHAQKLKEDAQFAKQKLKAEVWLMWLN